MEVNPNFSENAKNDIRLLNRAKEGDQKAYALLMKRYKDGIYFLALKMLHNKEDAMDITIETFTKAFRNLDKYNPSYVFSSWLFKMATHNCVDFIRKRRLDMISLDQIIESEGDRAGEESPLEIKDDMLNPEEYSIQKQLNEDLMLLVDSLPSRYRNLVLLFYFEELSYEDISKQLDLPLGSLKNQLFRARQLLQIIMVKKKINL